MLSVLESARCAEELKLEEIEPPTHKVEPGKLPGERGVEKCCVEKCMPIYFVNTHFCLSICFSIPEL